MLNRKKTRERILQRAKEIRFHEFTSVSPDVYFHLEMILDKEIEKIISIQPSKGKTIRMS